MSSLVPATTVALTVEGLCKSYGKAFTVGPLSFSLATGSTTGLLGGNGAGKTTTIGMIMGLIEPTSGQSACSATTWRMNATMCSAA